MNKATRWVLKPNRSPFTLNDKKRASLPNVDDSFFACRILFSVIHPSVSRAIADPKQLSAAMLAFPNKTRPKTKKGGLGTQQHGMLSVSV